MTSKEWAIKLIDALDVARRTGYVHEHELTEVAFDDAIATERERCAKIAETLWNTPTNSMATEEEAYGDEVAAAIRKWETP